MSTKIIGSIIRQKGTTIFLCLGLIAFLVFFLDPTSPTVLYTTFALFGFYLIYKLPPHVIFGRKLRWLLLIFVPLLLVPVLLADPEYEAVYTYQSVFNSLEEGNNPYTSGTIYHRVDDSVVLGNFNYPPMTIPFYWLAYLSLGAWNIGLMILVNLLVRVLVCIVFMKMTPKLRHHQRLPFYLFFLLLGATYPLTMTFLIVSLIMYYLMRNDLLRGKSAMNKYLYLPVLFSLGLLTKFFVVPIFFAYFYHYFLNLRKTGDAIKQIVLIGIMSSLILLPFGIMNVIDNTLLFNLNLGQRTVYTTFYPNIVSGPFSWLDAELAYALFAILAFGFFLYIFDKDLVTKIVYMCIAFMLLIPTPEPQYLVILFYIVIVGKYMELARQRPLASLPSSKVQQTLSHR